MCCCGHSLSLCRFSGPSLPQSLLLEQERRPARAWGALMVRAVSGARVSTAHAGSITLWLFNTIRFTGRFFVFAFWRITLRIVHGRKWWNFKMNFQILLKVSTIEFTLMKTQTSSWSMFEIPNVKQCKSTFRPVTHSGGFVSVWWREISMCFIMWHPL